MNKNNCEINKPDILSCPLLSEKNIFEDNFISMHIKHLNAKLPMFSNQKLLNLNLGNLEDELKISNEEIDSDISVTAPVDNIYTASPQEELTEDLIASNDMLSLISNEGRITIKTSENNVEAYITLHKPDKGMKKLTYSQLIEHCNSLGITYNVAYEFLQRLALHPVYETPFDLAKGIESIDGKDGYLKLHFDLEQKFIPEFDENGNIDFKNLKSPIIAAEGQLLCQIIDPVLSTDGINVFGESFSGIATKPASIICKKNIYFSVGGNNIYAACEGQISYLHGVLEVRSQLIVKEVNNETGNIDFAGNVLVQGDVLSGFSVVATGNINIRGSVGNSTLDSGGNITIYKGMNGDGFGSATCDGYFLSKFIENSTISAIGNIQSDSVLNSYIYSGDSINLISNRSRILGGECCACNKITTRIIGNEIFIPTKVTINTLSVLHKNLADIEEKQEEYTNVMLHLTKLFTLYQVLSKEDTALRLLFKIVFLYARTQNSYALLAIQSKEAEAKIQTHEAGYINVIEKIYPNVTININDIAFKLTRQLNSCLIYEKGNRIKINLERSQNKLKQFKNK